MGITSSSPKELTPLQKDIKYLGDRMPFGDADLYHVYKAYFKAKKAPSDEKISFLTDMGMLTFVGEQDGKDERLVFLQALEHKILPPNFGNRLYETSFLRPQDVNEYNNSKQKPVARVDDDDDDDGDEYTRLAKLEAFFDGLSNCSRRGFKKTLKVLMKCCHQNDPPTTDQASSSAAAPPPMDFAYNNTITTTAKPNITNATSWIEPVEFVTMGYRVALASGFLCAAVKKTTNDDEEEEEEEEDISRFLPDNNIDEDPGLSALAQSLKDFAAKLRQRKHRSASLETVTLVEDDEVYEWAEQVAPMFASSLATLIHMLFLPNRPMPPTRSNFEYPFLASGFDSAFFTSGNSPLLFSFACMSPALSGEYYRLYTSASDGLSFNRLQNSLLGYGGPTLIIIQSGESVFGAFTASQWKESKDFYGNTDCFLFQLLPSTAIYRPTGNDNKFMYCNPHARSRGYDQQAHGIGFGGTVDQPRLFLAESFDNCRAAAQDMTFERGTLLGGNSSTNNNNSNNFEIENLEVWGVGGTEVVMEALGARSRQRDIKDAAIQKARKVDKAAFLDDLRSGLIDSKAFAHRGQIQGRDAACVDVDELNAHVSDVNKKV